MAISFLESVLTHFWIWSSILKIYHKFLINWMICSIFSEKYIFHERWANNHIYWICYRSKLWFLVLNSIKTQTHPSSHGSWRFGLGGGGGALAIWNGEGGGALNIFIGVFLFPFNFGINTCTYTRVEST